MKSITFCGKYNKDYAECLKNEVISLLPKNTKLISMGVFFLCVFSLVNIAQLQFKHNE
jgi:hypothetical protein